MQNKTVFKALVYFTGFLTGMFGIYSLELSAFILTAHAREHVEIILPNNPYLTFKVRAFRVSELKSAMGYRLVSKSYPKTINKKSLEQK